MRVKFFQSSCVFIFFFIFKLFYIRMSLRFFFLLTYFQQNWENNTWRHYSCFSWFCLLARWKVWSLYMYKLSTLDPPVSLRPYLAVSFSMDIFHVYFEVVIPCKLLVAELALCHGAVGVVSQLVSDQHLLQAEGQVTNLRQWRQGKVKPSIKISSMYNTPKVTSLRPQPHIPAVLNKWAGLWKKNSFREYLKDFYSAWHLFMLYIRSGTTGTRMLSV